MLTLNIIIELKKILRAISSKDRKQSNLRRHKSDHKLHSSIKLDDQNKTWKGTSLLASRFNSLGSYAAVRYFVLEVRLNWKVKLNGSNRMLKLRLEGKVGQAKGNS
jgi:hypothetical protein